MLTPALPSNGAKASMGGYNEEDIMGYFFLAG
jgi:hypothetical protein